MDNVLAKTEKNPANKRNYKTKRTCFLLYFTQHVEESRFHSVAVQCMFPKKRTGNHFPDQYSNKWQQSQSYLKEQGIQKSSHIIRKSQFISDFPAVFAIRCTIKKTFKSQNIENVNNIQTEFSFFFLLFI